MNKIVIQWPIVIGVIGLIVSVFGALLGWGIFPAIIDKKIENSVILLEGTDQYKRFIELPQPILFKVYIFNVTNSDKIQNGALPVVEEIGPYVYKQYRQKTIKNLSKDGTKITYTQQQTFKFDEMASEPFKESDRITVLNMHMNAFLQKFESEVKDILKNLVKRLNNQLDRTPIIRIIKRILDRIREKRKSVIQTVENDPGLSILLRQLNENLNEVFNNPKTMFITTTVREYLFDGVKFCVNSTGFPRMICNQIEFKESKTIRTMNDGSLAFSFFNHKNRTHDGIYEVHTGLGNPQKLQEILKWDGSAVLHMWKNISDNELSICNLINGTDASIFPPFRKRGDSMYIFSSDICRSVQLFYEHDIKYNGIPGFRYSTRNFLNEIGPEYSTECFCENESVNNIKKKDGCLYAGAMDLTACIDAPVILTLPHMLGAAKEYTKLVKGLKPNKTKHQMYIDVQHMTGTPLQGGKRVQFNMFLRPINKITLTENLTTSLIPIIWIEEGIALNDEMVKMLKTKLIEPLFILDIIHWTIFISGIFLLFTSSILHIFKKRDPDSSAPIK